MRKLIFLPALITFFFSETSFAQNQQPTADECAALYPCQAPSAQPRRRTRRVPTKAAQMDPEILRRLETLEARGAAEPLIQVVPAVTPPSREVPTTVVRNYITMQSPPSRSEEQVSSVRFGLEVGGLASVHSSWWETSPGIYAAARLRLKRWALGIESGYQRIPFGDGSRVEDMYAGPTLGYTLGRQKMQFTLTAGFGFWSTLEDWVTPICGRKICNGENENALTISVEPGLLVNVVKNLEFSLGIPVRWIPRTPDGAEWTLGVRAGLGVFLPYP